MSRKTKLKLFTVLVLALAGIAYARWAYFPGAFVVADESFVYAKTWLSKDSLGGDTLISRSEGGALIINRDDSPHVSLTVSPDGKHIASLRVPDVVSEIVVRKAGLHADGEGRHYKMSRYCIPCGQSNLEWSPDSKRLAYAGDRLLYVLDTRTSRVATMKLPPEPSYERINKLWQGDAANKSTLNTYWIETSSTDAVPAQLTAELGAASQRLKSRLDIEPQIQFGVGHNRRNLDYFMQGPTDCPGVYEPFGFAGRHIRWASKDTIYCDNWRLTITKDTPHKMECKAERTAFPSEVFARPVLSPDGGKAAYLVPVVSSRQRDGWNPALLIIVDSSGKVLRQFQVFAQPRTPQWSKDGRYIVTWNFVIGRKSHAWRATIHKWQTSRSWVVFFPDYSGIDPKCISWDAASLPLR